jgi:hypothetical protein
MTVQRALNIICKTVASAAGLVLASFLYPLCIFGIWVVGFFFALATMPLVFGVAILAGVILCLG